ncbi:MAG: 4-hydroxybenzoate octaprenyltransferase [Planctomycetota bacterium]
MNTRKRQASLAGIHRSSFVTHRFAAVLQTVRHLLSLIRFSHTLFALPFALLAALMASNQQWLDIQDDRLVALFDATEAAGIDYLDAFTTGNWDPEGNIEDYTKMNGFHTISFSSKQSPNGNGLAFRWQEILGILLCMIFARSTAMAFNRIVDRDIDAQNPRTAGRHLPAGKLSLPQVNLFTLLSAMGFVASTAMFLPNRLPMYLSVPVLLFLCGYSYTKRFTPLAHFWLGAALAMSPVAAWVAIRGEVVMADPADLLPSVVLGAAVMAWVAGFDILYACQDYEFDRGAKLRSIPTALGIPGALRLAAACHAATVLCLAALPMVYPPFGWVYGAGIACVAALLLYEHLLVKPNNLDRVNLAFFNVNAVISVGLLVVGTMDLLL